MSVFVVTLIQLINKFKSMKKSIVSLVSCLALISLVAFPVFAEDTVGDTSALVIAPGEAKIPNTAEIKNFEKIRKIGNSLYGYPKLMAKIDNLKEKLSALEEKIANPSEIKNFEKIRKVGNALYGRRKLVATTITTEMVPCIQVAIDKKDLALTDALTAKNSNLKAAIYLRSTDQKEAIALTDITERNAKLKAIVLAYQLSQQNILAAFRSSHQKIKNQYKDDLKACKVDVVSAELEAGEVDNAL